MLSSAASPKPRGSDVTTRGTGDAGGVSRTARTALAVSGAVDRTITWSCRLLVLVSGIALTVVMTTNVFTRYFMASGGFAALQELPERLFPWFIVGGIALAAQAGGHMAVDWILGTQREAGKRLVLHLGNAIVVASYAVLFWQALEVAEIAQVERSPVLGLPGSHGYYAVALGCVALALCHATASLRIALLGSDSRFLFDFREI